jgi:hypothetical protein
MDQRIQAGGWPVAHAPCSAVDVDGFQHVWAIDGQRATRVLVDGAGDFAQPLVDGTPAAMKQCPAGDSCPTIGADALGPLTHFADVRLEGSSVSWRLLVPGCRDPGGRPAPTEWIRVDFDADVPPNTTLTVHARSGGSGSFADPAWANAVPTADALSSPLDLGDLAPNWSAQTPTAADGWLFVEVAFKTTAQFATPKLRSLAVDYRCQ